MPRCKQPTQFLSKYELTHRSNAVPVTLHIRSGRIHQGVAVSDPSAVCVNRPEF